MLKIAIYGKGGIGKSTTAANLSAALSEAGLQVMQIGIITAFEKLEELHAYEIYQPDVVIYDVLGDVVCGGFAMPLRRRYADCVFIVTSGEKMALFAASNIAKALDNFKVRNYARLAGLILNRRNIKNETELVQAAAERIGTRIIGDLPRCDTVQNAEEKNSTVLEAFPIKLLHSGRYRTVIGDPMLSDIPDMEGIRHFPLVHPAISGKLHWKDTTEYLHTNVEIEIKKALDH